MKKAVLLLGVVCVLLITQSTLAEGEVKIPGGGSMDTAVYIEPTYFTTLLQGEYNTGDGWYAITAPSTGTFSIRAKSGGKQGVSLSVTDRNGNQITPNSDRYGKVYLSESKWEIITVFCNMGETIYVHLEDELFPSGWNTSMTVCFDGYHQVSPYPVTTRESTCQGEGENTYFCELCDTAVTTESIPAKNHLPGTEGVIREATCLQTGIYGVVCTVCGEMLSSREIPLAAHTPGMYVTAREATCTGDGVRVQYCSVCNATVNTETVAAYGHSYTEWEVTVEATKQQSGEKMRYCIYCGNVQTEEIPQVEKLFGIF